MHTSSETGTTITIPERIDFALFASNQGGGDGRWAGRPGREALPTRP